MSRIIEFHVVDTGTPATTFVTEEAPDCGDLDGLNDEAFITVSRFRLDLRTDDTTLLAQDTLTVEEYLERGIS